MLDDDVSRRKIKEVIQSLEVAEKVIWTLSLWKVLHERLAVGFFVSIKMMIYRMERSEIQLRS